MLTLPGCHVTRAMHFAHAGSERLLPASKLVSGTWERTDHLDAATKEPGNAKVSAKLVDEAALVEKIPH